MAHSVSTREHRTEIPGIIWPREEAAHRFLSVVKKVSLLPLEVLWLFIFTFPLSAPIWFFIIWLSLR